MSKLSDEKLKQEIKNILFDVVVKEDKDCFKVYKALDKINKLIDEKDND